jgi:hypothetical protein
MMIKNNLLTKKLISKKMISEKEVLGDEISEILVSKKLSMPIVDIPSTVFQDRSLSVLEVMVEYLRDKKQMKFSKISELINRNERTVWTVYRRAKLKRAGLIKTSDQNE